MKPSTLKQATTAQEVMERLQETSDLNEFATLLMDALLLDASAGTRRAIVEVAIAAKRLIA